MIAYQPAIELSQKMVVQHVLREANRNTLDEVASFLQQDPGPQTYVVFS
jgi:hypothetical protein